jgi:hypothetical protein
VGQIYFGDQDGKWVSFMSALTPVHQRCGASQPIGQRLAIGEEAASVGKSDDRQAQTYWRMLECLEDFPGCLIASWQAALSTVVMVCF